MQNILTKLLIVFELFHSVVLNQNSRTEEQHLSLHAIYFFNFVIYLFVKTNPTISCSYNSSQFFDINISDKLNSEQSTVPKSLLCSISIFKRKVH